MGWQGRRNPLPAGVDLRVPGQILMAPPSRVPASDGLASYGPVSGTGKAKWIAFNVSDATGVSVAGDPVDTASGVFARDASGDLRQFFVSIGAWTAFDVSKATGVPITGNPTDGPGVGRSWAVIERLRALIPRYARERMRASTAQPRQSSPAEKRSGRSS